MAFPLQISACLLHSFLLRGSSEQDQQWAPFAAVIENCVLYLQGDISRIEKEFHVLQEQLQEACENYEQGRRRGSEEARALEEKLRRNVEENQVLLSEPLCQSTGHP